MSVHDKLVEHAFRRSQMREGSTPTEPVPSSINAAAGGTGGLAPTSDTIAPVAQTAQATPLHIHAFAVGTPDVARSSDRQPFAGGHQRRTGAFRRVAVVVRASY
jgi:hypothetical protein